MRGDGQLTAEYLYHAIPPSRAVPVVPAGSPSDVITTMKKEATLLINPFPRVVGSEDATDSRCTWFASSDHSEKSTRPMTLGHPDDKGATITDEVKEI